jgi:hypothetical protein
MARFSERKTIPEILSAVEYWKATCLLDGGSVFSDGLEARPVANFA